ncbi:MAG: FHA domain-containing protein, partial [Eggerthellaceae bacterium]
LMDVTNNRTYDLAAARLLMGRESKNDIVVPDLNASRQHAELRLEPQGVWVITDLGSTNGTFVNDREVATQPLAEGDRITIGMTNFVFAQA